MELYRELGHALAIEAEAKLDLEDRRAIIKAHLEDRGRAWTLEEIATLDDVRLGMTGARRISSLALDADGFLDSVMRDGNLRKVCGVSALYAFSRIHKKLFPQAKGEVLHYGHAADPTGGEVTFASMAFR